MSRAILPSAVHGENPRLLLAATFLSEAGGSRSVMEDLAQHLRENHEIVTVSRFRQGWARGADMLATTVARRNDYDMGVVDVFSGRAFLWAEGVCRLLRAFRKPHVLVLRGGDLPGFARRFPRRVERLLRHASVVTAPSGYLLDRMKDYRNDLDLLPNPIRLENYPFRLRAGARPRLVWLRAFHRMYNPVMAVEVLARLSADYPNAELVMVGRDKDGSLRDVQRAAELRGVSERLRLPGAVPKNDVARWLDPSDIFLNTTNVDNTPVSVLEAMACGLCVVSTNVGGIPYLLENGVDSLLVPPEDPAAMVAAVRRILTDPALAERFSASARQKASRCDWAVVLPRWKELIARAARLHAVPTPRPQ